MLKCRTFARVAAVAACLATCCAGAANARGKVLAARPPMGWNDWAHYQCGYTADTILANARALVSTGLAARGYRIVTIDDCWMQKGRDANGNLQPDPERFPHGMRPVAQAIHRMGLKFGIYEDAGSLTCGRFAGSGQPQGGGKDHFVQDARLFASWGVDYLKLDGCNVYVPPGSTHEAAYRAAYAAESAALKSAGRPIIFSESAPAYFQGTPEWYDVLSWVGNFGQLWREGSDIANFYGNGPPRRRFRAARFRRTRFDSVLWNYEYNLPLGRFQKPGNWDDADFIIAGDTGLSLAESRSQMALWSMMSAPLILSSDVAKLSPESIAVVSNKDIIAVDQDPLGRMATLVRRSIDTDVLFKQLTRGYGAVAALNRGATPAQVVLQAGDLGFRTTSRCRFEAENLWTGSRERTSELKASIAPHDTAIWKIRPSAACGRRARQGAMIVTDNTRRRFGSEGYTRCLAAAGSVEPCKGTAAESWTVLPGGMLRASDGRCLTAGGGAALGKCRGAPAQQWHYSLTGNLVSESTHQCLTAAGTGITTQPCEHNLSTQIWSLPN